MNEPQQAKKAEYFLWKGPFRINHLIVLREFVGNHVQTTQNMLCLKSDDSAIAPRQEPPQKNTTGS